MVEFLAFIFGVWIAVQAALFAVRKGRLAYYRSRFSADCAVCGQPNFQSHGCTAWAMAKASQRVRMRVRNGMMKNWKWEGWIVDRRGDLWRCGHDHWQRPQAKACADARIRMAQKGQTAPLHAVAARPRTAGKQSGYRRPATIDGVTNATWAALVKRHQYRCYYCKTSTLALVREHRVPLAVGGSNHIGNIVPACTPCNSRKGTLTDVEFFALMNSDKERARRLAEQAAKRAAAKRMPF